MSAVGNRPDGCKLTFPGICFSRPSGRVTRPERSLFLHSVIHWPDLQSPPVCSVRCDEYFFILFFFAQDGVLARQNALCMCCVRGTDKTVAPRTGLVGSLRFGSSASKGAHLSFSPSGHIAVLEIDRRAQIRNSLLPFRKTSRVHRPRCRAVCSLQFWRGWHWADFKFLPA